MNTLFADTSFFVAINSRRDSLHARAKEVASNHLGRMITTEFVLVEVGNFFCQGVARKTFRRMMDQLLIGEEIDVLPASSSLFRQGLAFFFTRPDKEWSLTDCISFVVMHEHGIINALTADYHFDQAGFTVLLK